MDFIFLSVLTSFSVVPFLGLLFFSDPFLASGTVIFMFFSAMFLSLAGIFSICGAVIAKFGNKKAEYTVFLRRGIFLGLVVLSMVLLQKFLVLNLGNASALVMLVVGMEMMFAYQTKNSARNGN